MAIWFGVFVLSSRRYCLMGRLSRQREVGSEGWPTIRYWGGAILCGACSLLWAGVLALNFNGAFQLRHPGSFAVEGACLVLSLCAALWLVYFKATLAEDAIVIDWFPWVKRRYLLADIAEIRRWSKRTILIELRSGKLVKIFNGSGVAHFLDAVSQRKISVLEAFNGSSNL